MEPQPLPDRIDHIEKVMDSFYRRNASTSAELSAKTAIDEFNKWAAAQQEQLEADRISLDKDDETVRAMETQIDEADQALEKEKTNATENDSVVAYNQHVEERNALIKKYHALCNRLKEKQADLNGRIEAFNQEGARRKDAVESLREEAATTVQNYQQWLNDDGPTQFFTEVNRAFALVLSQIRHADMGPSPDLQSMLGRLRNIRSELASRARQDQSEAEHGLMLVDARVCDEPCLVMVDNGATICSLSPEMVDALNMKDCVGEQVELSLPNALRTKAPQLVIPSVEVDGVKSEFVKAVVLQQSMPGVDGCLGLSFLHRFNYSLDKHHLDLNAPTELHAPTTSAFDVFICHKAEDYQKAKTVYDALTKAGRRPFLSKLSCPETHKSEFQKVIDETLERAAHLVVICSSRENVEAPWVQSEWRMFEGLKRSGRKTGNIVPVFCGAIRAFPLPVALTQYQSVALDDTNWESVLISYLPL